MKTVFEKAVTTYNNIMMDLGREYDTIGTEYSVNTQNWNLRDLVSECAYQLSTYFEGEHFNAEMRYSEDKRDRREWKNQTSRLQRFIDKYKPFVINETATQKHCSEWD